MSKSAEKKLTVYTAKSPLMEPGKLFREMLSDLKASLGLAMRLTGRDIAAQYRQTALGYLWAVLPPLVTSLTFILLSRANVIETGAMSLPYPVFVIAGTIFWQLFVDALNAPLKVVNVNRAMLSKISFPKEALVISGILQVLFGFAIKLVLLFVVIAIFRVPVQLTAFAALFSLLGLLGIGTLCGVFLVPIGVLYQDIREGLLIMTGALMFFSPVVYPPPTQGFLATIIAYNPLTPFLMLCREAFFDGTLLYLPQTLAIMGVAAILLLAGWVMYRVSLPIIIERMDA
jgi:lipopolysaccharide transport system permease protein